MMGKEITMPDRAQRLYTQRDYLDALMLAGGSEKLALAQEEERGCGFGFMYMNLTNEMLDYSKHPLRARIFRQLNEMGKDTGAEGLRDMVNDEFSGVRKAVSVKLNQYAKRRGGIDVWPEHEVHAGVSAHGWAKGEKTEDVHIHFGFFAPDFRIRRAGDTNMIERGNALTLHPFKSGMSVPQELQKARARCEELRRVKKPTAKQRRAGIIKTVFSFFPLVIAVLCAGALLLWALSGASPNEAMGDLALMYEFMTSNLFVFISMLAGIVMAGLMCTGLLRLFLDPELIPAQDVKKGIEAQRELEQIENDPHIEAIWQDYRRRRAQEEEQVNAWQEEWFEVCRLKRGM